MGSDERSETKPSYLTCRRPDIAGQTDPMLERCAQPLTAYRFASGQYLICSEIEDGYGGKSCRAGAGQRAGRDCRDDRSSPAADRPIRAWLMWTPPSVCLLPQLEPETIPAKRIRQSDLRSEPGGLSRCVLIALRRSGAPMRAPDLVRAVMIDSGLDPADRASSAERHHDRAGQPLRPARRA